MRRLVLISALSVGSLVQAATPYKQSLDVKKDTYLTQGVFTGGRATGRGTSLIAVKRQFSAKAELERIVVAMGDAEAKPLKDELGFFQVSLDRSNKRLVLDVAQLKLSKVTEGQVQQLFRQSPYVARVRLTLDPEDSAATLLVDFKTEMKLETYQLHKPARIVMDLKPLRISTRK